jgi:hypothetical protein
MKLPPTTDRFSPRVVMFLIDIKPCRATVLTTDNPPPTEAPDATDKDDPMLATDVTERPPIPTKLPTIDSVVPD